MTRLLAVFALVAHSVALGQDAVLPEPQVVELENGAVFIVLEKPDVPLIGITALVRGGAITDPADKAGLASLFAAMLEKGAGYRNAAAFAEAVDGAGATLSASGSLEYIAISGDFLAKDSALAVELLAEMLQDPKLEAGEFTKLRDRRIDLIRAAKDSDPRALTPIYGKSWLFADHPYGSPVNGDETSLENISHADLLAYYEDFVGADRLVVSIVGDIDADAIIDALTESFGEWREAGQPMPDIEDPVPYEGRRVLLVDKPGATQSYFWIGNVGVARGFERRAELDIANTLFGGRFTSLLVDELRTKGGLTYGASSNLMRPTRPGSFAIVSYTKTETTAEAMDLAIALLGRLLKEGFTEELIASGKNYILGQYPLSLETASQLASQYARLQVAGLGTAHVNDYAAAIVAASGEAIQAVINEVYPRRRNLVIAVIGDAEQLRNTVAKYGLVTEMSITEPRFTP